MGDVLELDTTEQIEGVEEEEEAVVSQVNLAVKHASRRLAFFGPVPEMIIFLPILRPLSYLTLPRR